MIPSFFKIPGDKSLSHRALILGALLQKPVEISGLNRGEDVQRTLEAMQSLGVQVIGNDPLTLIGPQSFSMPKDSIDCGNSGTTARLLLGLLCRQKFASSLYGDASLSQRPMKRILDPLRTFFGGVFDEREELPLRIAPSTTPLPQRDITISVPSAQLKTALILAALLTKGETRLVEIVPTRPQTENLLSHWGFSWKKEGSMISVQGENPDVCPRSLSILGDPSAAAFGIVAGLIGERSVCVPNVMSCPFRLRFIDKLKAMKGIIVQEGLSWIGYPSSLHALEIEACEAPSLIDEYPALSMAAACAKGISVFRGLKELRVKESNRLSVISENLRACGVRSWCEDDDLYIEGTSNIQGGRIETHNDHRIALAFSILDLTRRQGSHPMIFSEKNSIRTSFPDFFKQSKNQDFSDR